MNPEPDPELIDDENPEWTDEDFARAVPLSGLPMFLQEPLRSESRVIVTEGPLTQPFVPVLLLEEVVAVFRSTGDGWELRLSLALQDWLATHSPTEV